MITENLSLTLGIVCTVIFVVLAFCLAAGSLTLFMSVLAIVAGCAVKEAVADGRLVPRGSLTSCTVIPFPVSGSVKRREMLSGVWLIRTIFSLAFKLWHSCPSLDMSFITLIRWDLTVRTFISGSPLQHYFFYFCLKEKEKSNCQYILPNLNL